MIAIERLRASYERARDDLLAERTAAGHWIGGLSSSALSTATAISALSLVQRGTNAGAHHDAVLRYDGLIQQGLNWILQQQNADGGWGDTDKSYSNISTTMLVVAAFHLAARADAYSDVLQRAWQYLDKKGWIKRLRERYGIDKTFAVPILTNCALAGLVPWREVSPLPFEAACVPQKFYRFMRMPVVSYAIPALVAIGQARFFKRRPLNPIVRLVREAAVSPSLQVLEQMQPASGGYLEAIPLTSFVVMALAGTGRAEHPVVTRGVEFLQSSVRTDGSWPIDTNLATWNTTLAINALAGSDEDITELGCLDWLLGCQQNDVHPLSGARPGGWGWSDLSGAVPDADDTPSTLLALANWYRSERLGDEERRRIREAAQSGVTWLLDLQNRNGGWPTFCRGWGKLPFDRSGADLTAHALRALYAWRTELHLSSISRSRWRVAMDRGLKYLRVQQRRDGSWIPLWFGNQDHPQEENPVYGTAKVLMAQRDLGLMDTHEARRGLRWLKEAQNEDGGWGGGPAVVDHGVDLKLPCASAVCPDRRVKRDAQPPSSVEETALAVEALLAAADDPTLESTIDKGLRWLCCKVESNQHGNSAPIGFYFAKLWYYERLYPLTFTVSALGQAVRRSHRAPDPKLKNSHQTAG